MAPRPAALPELGLSLGEQHADDRARDARERPRHAEVDDGLAERAVEQLDRQRDGGGLLDALDVEVGLQPEDLERRGGAQALGERLDVLRLERRAAVAPRNVPRGGNRPRLGMR